MLVYISLAPLFLSISLSLLSVVVVLRSGFYALLNVSNMSHLSRRSLEVMKLPLIALSLG